MTPTTPFRPLIAAGLLLCLASTAEAGINVWTSNGPEGSEALALAIDPTTPATLYAGTLRSGVFKSVDAGGSWSAINFGLTSTNVWALAIDPTTPTTLYAGTDGGGLFKSVDAGGSWSSISSGLAYRSFWALAIDPTTPTTLYAGTAGGAKVFRSVDGGVSWSAASSGLPNGRSATFVAALAIDPTTPTTLYAGTHEGVFKSLDAGASWSGVFSAGTVLAIDPTTPTTLYAGTPGGVFKSLDAGGSWSAVNTGLTDPDVGALAIDPTTPATLYAGTRGGVFKSVDAGGSWSAVNAGLTHPNIRALAIDPTTPATLYAGTFGGGVFRLTQAAACMATSSALCLNGGRFQVEARWLDFAGNSGAASGQNLTADTGYFWFFTPNNVEVIVKMLDACHLDPFNNYWFFASGLTNVGVTLTVNDTETGETRTYENPLGQAFQPIQDTTSFAVCSTSPQG